MEIDHIFIFTDNHGEVADELVAFGLTEGSGRVHPGQGTTNRKFYFENFFLEIVWVHNESEITSESIKPTGLWQRANYKTNNFSPFGLGIENTAETERLFEKAIKYQPVYYPPGLTFDILTNEHQPELPWTFRSPFKGQNKNDTEPIEHNIGLRKLTKAQFTYKNENAFNFVDMFSEEQNIVFLKSSDVRLILTFDNRRNGLSKEFEKLKLTIEY